MSPITFDFSKKPDDSKLLETIAQLHMIKTIKETKNVTLTQKDFEL